MDTPWDAKFTNMGPEGIYEYFILDGNGSK
jgi:hypothetical protein